MKALELQGLRRGYLPGTLVLDGVDLALDAGEVVGLLGRNGAGKTTLMRLALGMLEPEGGSVRVFGRDPRRHPVEVKQEVGYVAEEQILPGDLRGEDVVELHRSLFPTWDADLARDIRVRLDVPLRPRVREMSKGQARRLALLCALAHRPRLLLLDEPAGGLDPAARREFLEISVDFLAETEAAVLFSTHHVGDLERLAARVAILHDGRVAADGTPEDLVRAAGVPLEDLFVQVVRAEAEA